MTAGMASDPERTDIRVLHVEDDEAFTEKTAERLEGEDDRFTVRHVKSPTAAFDRLEAEAVACVITDWGPAETDGLAFLKEMRAAYPELPIILFTEKEPEDIASEAISAGVTEYVQQSPGSGQFVLLAHRIRQAVERAGLQTRGVREAPVDQTRQLRAVLDAIDAAVWMRDTDQRFLLVNQEYRDLFGIRDDLDIVGKRPAEVLPTHLAERFVAKDEAVLEDRAPVEVEEVVSRNGEERIAITRVTPLFNETGEIDATCGIASDITEQKRREEELALKTKAMEEAPMGIILSDPTQPDNPIVEVNAAFSRLTGYSREEALGRNCRFLQGPDTEEAPVQEMREAVKNRSDVSVELRNYRKDGTSFWNRVTFAPLYNDTGELSHFVGFQQDVSERKEREQELQAERAFLEDTLDALGDIFFVFRPDDPAPGRWNQRLLDVTGYGEPDMRDMEFLDFFPEDEHDRVLSSVGTVLATGEDRLEADMLTAHGERIPYEFSGVYIDIGEGAVAGIGRDISARKRRERTLARQNKRLEEFNKMVSHDLRNPLTVAAGRVDLLDREYESEHIEKIKDAHDRIEALIDDMLELAREGYNVTDTESIEIGPFVKTTWENVDTKAATLEVTCTGSMFAAGGHLKQLLENLFRNAIEHGGDDVHVTVGDLDDGFYVADDGPGIPADEREQVFDAGYSSSEGGTGFGLHIVTQVIDGHDWEIHLTESKQGGARFEITEVDRPDDTADT